MSDTITLLDGTTFPVSSMSPEQLREFMRLRRTRRHNTSGLDVVAYLHPTKGWKKGPCLSQRAVEVKTRDGQVHDLRVH